MSDCSIAKCVTRELEEHQPGHPSISKASVGLYCEEVYGIAQPGRHNCYGSPLEPWARPHVKPHIYADEFSREARRRNLAFSTVSGNMWECFEEPTVVRSLKHLLVSAALHVTLHQQLSRYSNSPLSGWYPGPAQLTRCPVAARKGQIRRTQERQASPLPGGRKERQQEAFLRKR